MPINRDFFFSYVRQHLFAGTLKASPMAGLTSLLDEWDAHHQHEDDRWLAYVLATAHHETDRTIRPIHEYGGNERFRKLYDIGGIDPARAGKMGNTEPGDGVKYHGRGFVQLTWKVNYQKAGAALGVGDRFVTHPDEVLDLANATRILFAGMIAGWFTGKKLGDYFAPGKADWVNARRIINGTDKANLIAGYGQSYYAALSYTT